MASIPPPKIDTGIDAFCDLLKGMGSGCRGIGRAIAGMIEVPYREERESDAFLGHRLKEIPQDEALARGLLLPLRRFRRGEEVLDIEGFPPVNEDWDQLTEEVWSKGNWPDSFNDPVEAVNRLPDGVAAIYYHGPSMNLVLVGARGEKVGIRSTSLARPGRGLNAEGVRILSLLRRASLP